MPEEKDQSANQPSFQYSKDPDFRSVYTNNAIFASTAFDFSMIFAEIMDVDEAGVRISAEQRVKVVMSPLHFKLFAEVCAQNVKQYEDRFGAIKLPTGEAGGVVADTVSKAR